VSFVPPDVEEEPDIFPPPSVIEEESKVVNNNGVPEPSFIIPTVPVSDAEISS